MKPKDSTRPVRTKPAKEAARNARLRTRENTCLRRSCAILALAILSERADSSRTLASFHARILRWASSGYLL